MKYRMENGVWIANAGDYRGNSLAVGGRDPYSQGKEYIWDEFTYTWVDNTGTINSKEVLDTFNKVDKVSKEIKTHITTEYEKVLIPNTDYMVEFKCNKDYDYEYYNWLVTLLWGNYRKTLFIYPSPSQTLTKIEEDTLIRKIKSEYLSDIVKSLRQDLIAMIDFIKEEIEAPIEL